MEQHRKKRAGDRNDGAAIGGRGPAAMMAIDGGKQQRALCGVRAALHRPDYVLVSPIASAPAGRPAVARVNANA
jgi:hypothetical protein